MTSARPWNWRIRAMRWPSTLIRMTSQNATSSIAWAGSSWRASSTSRACTPRDPHYATWRYLFDKQFRDVPMVKGRLKRLVGDTTLDFVHRHGLTLWLGFVAAALAVSPTAFLFLYIVPLGSAHLVGAIHQVTSHRGGSPRNLAWLEYLLPTGGEWTERVNDFAAPGVMNLLRRVLSISGRRSPMVVG
jgi:hypothetical protein